MCLHVCPSWFVLYNQYATVIGGEGGMKWKPAAGMWGVSFIYMLLSWFTYLRVISFTLHISRGLLSQPFIWCRACLACKWTLALIHTWVGVTLYHNVLESAVNFLISMIFQYLMQHLTNQSVLCVWCSFNISPFFMFTEQRALSLSEQSHEKRYLFYLTCWTLMHIFCLFSSSLP